MWDFYETESPIQILFVTVLLGGGAAWLAGRAIAQTWRPLGHVVVYMLLLAAAVRFIHFALFEAALISPLSYAADVVFLLAVACLAFRVTRTTQMVTQYDWLYERVGPLSWRDRAAVHRRGGDTISG